MVDSLKFFSLALCSVIALGSCGKKPPQALDLSAHYTEKYDDSGSGKHSDGGITGNRSFDGVPFSVHGRAILYGRQLASDENKGRLDYPDVIGVKVGRAFDELHLLHTTKWPDVEGMTVARARLNYADGTKSELDIGYGVHVRDWQRLQSEQLEALSDPRSKVVWRGEGVGKFKSSQRMFKSVLLNPNKSKKVDTIDFVSAEGIASYCLFAATVADSDPSRPLKVPVPQERPEWDFDGRVHFRVLDERGYPIVRALVDVSLGVPGSGWATSGAPVYSSAEGTGIVNFPRDRTSVIMLNVSKVGWKSESKQLHLEQLENPEQGIEVTFRLSPSSP